MKALAALALSAALFVTCDLAAAQSTTGTIRGRVTAADTGRPLRRARIMLQSTSNTQMRPIAGPGTNSLGEFELKDVPPGSYYVSADRAGFITLQHGQRRPGDKGVPIEVKAGQTIARIDIALPRGGVISGRLTDETGEPYAGLRVLAFALRYQQGRRVPMPAGVDITDDGGDYRIAGLAPGSYYISASSSETWRNEKKETFGYATTYYPGNAPVPQAIVVGLSQERSGMDFSLAAARTARISGRALRATGEPMANAPVGVSFTIKGMNFTLGSGNPASVRTQADGSFELRDIAPGDYILRVVDQRDSARQAITVTGDLENFVLTGENGSTVSGSIVTDEGEPPPFSASGVQLALIAPYDNVLPTVRFPGVNRDWTFRLSGLGGPFLFRPQNLSDEWMLDAVKLNDRDLTDVPWDVPTGGKEISGLQIVITMQAGRIDGNVTTSQGKATNDATVVVFSEDANHWLPGSRFIRMARPTVDGQFSIRGLPAGNYFVIAREFIEEGQWEDKTFLESVRFDAARVTLTRGGAETVRLKLPPGRD